MKSQIMRKCYLRYLYDFRIIPV